MYYLGQNIVSFIGVVLTTSSAITLITFWIYDFLLPGPSHPYVGILLFLILPGVFILGLLLIPLGILLRRQKLRAAGELPSEYPAIDLKLPMVRNGLLFVVVTSALNVLIFTYASYKGVAYMDSTAFCGQTYHSVMAPEFSVYQNSPHARVECVYCHIGPGAGWFVRSKLSGLRQVYAVTFKTYSTPIPTPVKYLRPARDTCERCHWPQRFSGDGEDQLQGRRKEHGDDHRAADEDRRAHLARRDGDSRPAFGCGFADSLRINGRAAAGESSGVLHG